MNSSDRVAEDGHLKPPASSNKPQPPVPDFLELLHAEHHQGVMVPTLDSCDQHTREAFEKDYGHLVQQQAAKRRVEPGVGFLEYEGPLYTMSFPTFVGPDRQVEFKSPPFVHKLVDAIITRRTLDFGEVPVPEDVKRRLEEAFGPVTYQSLSGPRTEDELLPPPTYKLRAALGDILNGRESRAVRIVKDFTPEDARKFLNALETLQAMLMARYSVEYIDEMLTVEP